MQYIRYCIWMVFQKEDLDNFSSLELRTHMSLLLTRLYTFMGIFARDNWDKTDTHDKWKGAKNLANHIFLCLTSFIELI